MRTHTNLLISNKLNNECYIIFIYLYIYNINRNIIIKKINWKVFFGLWIYEKVDPILKFLSANFLLKRVYFLNRIRDFTYIYIYIDNLCFKLS